ncbi:hypothetical protein CDEST_06846 [Colletotrichum destructivum]|uniref:Uncharacterized protein n=1 Tax=Colletotrichum destructivum TaxID=34406 RepID=A0AAX4IEX6_9PEZI|nr:hypothetical protein CDEST_06846 [Colletotrichum destructivum]
MPSSDVRQRAGCVLLANPACQHPIRQTSPGPFAVQKGQRFPFPRRPPACGSALRSFCFTLRDAVLHNTPSSTRQRLEITSGGDHNIDKSFGKRNLYFSTFFVFFINPTMAPFSRARSFHLQQRYRREQEKGTNATGKQKPSTNHILTLQPPSRQMARPAHLV